MLVGVRVRRGKHRVIFVGWSSADRKRAEVWRMRQGRTAAEQLVMLRQFLFDLAFGHEKPVIRVLLVAM